MYSRGNKNPLTAVIKINASINSPEIHPVRFSSASITSRPLLAYSI